MPALIAKKRWKIRKKLKQQLLAISRNSELSHPGPAGSLLTRILKKKLALSRPRLACFGRPLRPADILVFALASVTNFQKDVYRLIARLNYYRKSIKHLKRLKRAYITVLPKIRESGFLNTNSIINNYVKLGRLLSLRIKVLKKKKTTARSSIAKFSNFLKLFRKATKKNKKIVFSLTNYFFLASVFSTTPSAFNLLNSFMFDNFFASVRKRGVIKKNNSIYPQAAVLTPAL
jgi:hypothetical protein